MPKINFCHYFLFLWKKKIKYPKITKERALEIDAISKRYGKLPSDLLQLRLDDYQFNLLVYSVYAQTVHNQGKK